MHARKDLIRDAENHRAYLAALEDPEKMDALLREVDLHDPNEEIDDTADSFAEMLRSMEVIAEAAKIDAEENRETLRVIEHEIGAMSRLVNLLHLKDYQRVAKLLQDQAAALRTEAEALPKGDTHPELTEQEKKKAYLLSGIPHRRIEADVLDQFAELLLLEGSPLW